MWWNRYVGIPFEWDGHAITGASCWGLVWLVQKQVFGKNLPLHHECETVVRNGDHMDAAPYFAHGIPVGIGEAKEGDVAHMWAMGPTGKTPTHCGVIAGNGYVLHTSERTGSVIQPYDREPVSRRLLGIYRIVED